MFSAIYEIVIIKGFKMLEKYNRNYFNFSSWEMGGGENCFCGFQFSRATFALQIVSLLNCIIKVIKAFKVY